MSFMVDGFGVRHSETHNSLKYVCSGIPKSITMMAMKNAKGANGCAWLLIHPKAEAFLPELHALHGEDPLALFCIARFDKSFAIVAKRSARNEKISQSRLSMLKYPNLSRR